MGILTPDDIQAIADLAKVIVRDEIVASEKRQDQKFVAFEKRQDERFVSFEKRQDQKFVAFEKRQDLKFVAFEKRQDQKFVAFEKRQDLKFATKDEMKELIRDTVSQVVEEKVTEHIGLLPTREEFFTRMDQVAGVQQKQEQELTVIKHQLGLAF